MGIDIKNIADYNEMFRDFDFSEVILRKGTVEYQFRHVMGTAYRCEHLNDEAERLFRDTEECGEPALWTMQANQGNRWYLCPAHVLTELGQQGSEVARGAIKLSSKEEGQ